MLEMVFFGQFWHPGDQKKDACATNSKAFLLEEKKKTPAPPSSHIMRNLLFEIAIFR